MAYTKQTWSDLPSKTTPINASRLGHIEQGIYDAAATADNASTAISAMGTAVSKNSTNAVTQNSGDLVESGAVYTAIANAKASCYKPSGDKTCAELVAGLLVQSNLGNVYNITDSGTTTSDFVGGAGKPISVGDNVAIVDVGSSVYKFDLLAGMVDLSNYQTKALSAQVEGQSTVEGALGALSNADRATRQLIDDTIGWESINQIPLTLDYLKSINTVGTWSGNTYTRYGVTYTIETDNNGAVTKITANNTASANAVLNLWRNFTLSEKCLMNGITGGSATTYVFNAYDGTTNYYAYDGEDSELPANNYSYVAFVVLANKSVNNVEFYPMVRKAVYSNITAFEPYHPSVDSCKCDNTVIAPVENGATASQAYSTNDFFMRNGELYIATTSIAQGATFTEGTNCTKKTVGEILTALLNA